MDSWTDRILPSRTLNTPMQWFSYGRPSSVRARLVHCRATLSPSAIMPVISSRTDPG
jgi:hypothetical protein